MMRNFIFMLLMLVCSNTGNTTELTKRTLPETLRTSIIIPCHYKHFHLLTDLLGQLQQQTVLPDEIVISLSECNKLSNESIRAFEEIEWPFRVVLIKNIKKLSAGENRNAACRKSTGNLFICQDADDLPHPQRIELIKYLFENYHIDHLMHQFTFLKDAFQAYDKEKSAEQCHMYSKYEDINIPDFTNGNCSLTREVFSNVQWSKKSISGEDKEFNQKVYLCFKQNVVAELNLLLYRNDLSSFSQ